MWVEAHMNIKPGISSHNTHTHYTFIMDLRRREYEKRLKKWLWRAFHNAEMRNELWPLQKNVLINISLSLSSVCVRWMARDLNFSSLQSQFLCCMQNTLRSSPFVWWKSINSQKSFFLLWLAFMSLWGPHSLASHIWRWSDEKRQALWMNYNFSRERSFHRHQWKLSTHEIMQINFYYQSNTEGELCVW